MRNEQIHNSLRVLAMSLLFLVLGSTAFAQKPAGTTADRATRVADTTMLTVQSGGNFIRIEPNHLPAAVIYMPDTAFGPIPTGLVMGETVEAQVFFSDCRMGWKWIMEEAEETQLMEIKAHENASLRVEPTIRYTYLPTEETACDKYKLGDKELTVSGEYPIDTTIMPNGDREVRTLLLTINNSTSFSQEIKQYEPFVSATGKTYTSSGDYRDTIPNAIGCDSVILTNFTLLKTAYDTLRPVACDNYTYNGKSFTQSVKFNDTILAESGDRTIKTIELTVNHTTYETVVISEYDSYTSPQGKTYTESGDYEEKITNAAGCDSIITLRITIKTHNIQYETVYFCRGFNTEHEEQVDEEHIRIYKLYEFESPALLWDDVMAKATKQSEASRVLMDLNEAAAAFRSHYVDPLTPIETIDWSIAEGNASVYKPVVVESAPQWVPAGILAVQIRFRCGEIYTNEYPTALETVETGVQKPIKRIENGQVVILRGDAVYTPLGQKIK
ncbi:MAG: hypothetical protein IKT13_01790 [Paludibacteraceae bacterium]|nr:hypothetical protein [Paludibacteraceae bacterium]